MARWSDSAAIRLPSVAITLIPSDGTIIAVDSEATLRGRGCAGHSPSDSYGSALAYHRSDQSEVRPSRDRFSANGYLTSTELCAPD